ncbi:MAG: hypothetical protein WDA21_03035 [Bacilli bacterium]
MRKILVGLVMVMLLSGCKIEKIEQLEKTDVFVAGYDVDDSHVFVNTSSNDIINIFKRGTGIIYFGYPESLFCQEIVKILDEISKQNDIKQIYYLNVNELKKSNPSAYQEILSLVSDYLYYEDEANNKILYLPDVYFVKDGNIIGNHISTNIIHDELVHSEGEWIDLTRKEKNEIKNIFLGLLTQLYSCNCSCN